MGVARAVLCVMSGYGDAVFAEQETAPGAVVILTPAWKTEPLQEKP